MSDTMQVAQEKVDAPAEWGSREEIYALGKRIQAILPGKLTVAQSLLLAQYGHVMDANAARGEIYAYEHRGKLILVEGYKLLVRWARRQCQFYERYERVTNDTDAIPSDAIAFRCRILRQDAVEDLATLTQAGVPNAYELCSTEAVGIVTKKDRTKRNGEPQDPPATWTWEQVARKNALKNALRIAYGAPSPREIAAESWMIDDIETIPPDWEDVTPAMSIAESEATAKYNAKQRLLADERTVHPSTRSAVQDTAELFGGEIIECPAGPGKGVRETPAKDLAGELKSTPESIRDIDAIKTMGDLWAACQQEFNLTRAQALRELGVAKQEHLGAREPREFYQQIAAAMVQPTNRETR